MAGSDLATIKLVYELYPQALTVPQGTLPENLSLLLYISCNMRTKNEDVIAFLACKFPPAARTRGLYGDWPIHRLLRPKLFHGCGETRVTTYASLKAIRCLTEAYPESVQFRDEATGILPFEFAMKVGYDVPILAYLQEQTSDVGDTFQILRVLEEGARQWDLDIERSMILEKILPTVKEFSWDTPFWTHNGFLHLLGCLSSNTSIQEVHLPVATSLNRDPIQRQEMMASYQRFFQRSTSQRHVILRHFPIQVPHPQDPTKTVEMADSERLRSCIQACKRGLESGGQNDNLRRLTLDQFPFDGDLGLGELMASRSAPQEIHVNKCFFQGSWNPDMDLSTSACKNFVAIESDFIPSALSSLMRAASNMPKLEAFCLLTETTDELPSFDFTSEFLSLLGSPTLEFLTFEVFEKTGPTKWTVKESHIWEALKHNTTLKHYMFQKSLNSIPKLKSFLETTLMEHNTTLQKVEIEDSFLDHPLSKRVHHYTRLNRFGRGMIRKSESTVEDLVDCLCNIQNYNGTQSEDPDSSDEVDDDSSDEAGDLVKFSCQYGLLRDVPNLWTNDRI